MFAHERGKINKLQINNNRLLAARAAYEAEALDLRQKIASRSQKRPRFVRPAVDLHKY